MKKQEKKQVVNENAQPTFVEICESAKNNGINAYTLLQTELSKISPVFQNENEQKEFADMNKEIISLQEKISCLQEKISPLQTKGYLQALENVISQIVTYYPQNSGENVILQRVNAIGKYYTTFAKKQVANVTTANDVVEIAKHTYVEFSKREKHFEAREKVASIFEQLINYGMPRNITTFKLAYINYITSTSKKK